MRSKLKIEEGAKAILILILLAELFLINGIYLILCTVCAYFILINLLQPFKSSVFTLLFIYHVLQIGCGILFYTYQGVDIDYKVPNTSTATIACVIGVFILFLPIIYYINKMPAIALETLKKHASLLSINKSFYAYMIAFFAAGFLSGIRFYYPGLASTLTTLINVKWLFFSLFGFQVILKKKRKKEFYAFIALEILIGFTSFFSDFKTVIFYLVVLYLTFITSVTTKRLLISLGIVTVIFFAVLFWSGVKSEYRSFLNKGSSTQSVQVSKNEALSKLYDLSNNKKSTFETQITVLLDRLQATENFAKTINRVPAIIPYRNGTNWSETFEFVLTPRIINPNKPILDFSQKVSKYTGIQHAGLAQGTSFSLGYFVDSYIDFGLYGMMIPLFLLGIFLGYMHLYFIKSSSSNFIFNYSVAGAVFMEFFALEMDITYLIGRLFSALVTFFLLKKLFFPWLLRYLSEKRETKFAPEKF